MAWHEIIVRPSWFLEALRNMWTTPPEHQEGHDEDTVEAQSHTCCDLTI